MPGRSQPGQSRSYRVDKVLVVQALGPTPDDEPQGEFSASASLDDLRA